MAKTIFDIVADYRPQNQNKPHYFVWAVGRSEARRIFENHISWLKIYSIQPVTEEALILSICEHPEKYIVLGRQ